MFSSLFDWKFEKLITRSVLGVLYLVLVVVISVAAIAALVYSVVGGLYGYGVPGSLFLLFIATPVVWFVSIMTLRVAFETSIALILIAENTKK